MFLQNSTESEVHNNLPKRHVATATAVASASSSLLGGNLWDNIPLDHLDAHSCGVEAFEYGHVHVSGSMVHEFFCELRKLWHYVLIILRNLKSGLTLGPLIAEDVMANSHTNIFGHLFHHGSQLFDAIIREPHHLLILPEIFCDSIPFPSITGAIHRFIHIFFKLVHFVRDLFLGHIRHIFEHFFFHHHLGMRLREKLSEIQHAKLHYLQRFKSILPIEQSMEPIMESIVSTSSATASATATTYQNEPIIVPDYHKSLAEVLTSFRGAYDGYCASGIPHLIKTGVKSFSSATAISTITSYLYTPLRNYFGCEPTSIKNTEISAPSSVSACVDTSTQGSVISPIVPTVPILPIESEIISSSASASAVVATEAQPVISSAPMMVPSYISLTEPVSTSSPMIIPDTVENTISESSFPSMAAPEIIVPNTLGNTASSAAASASSSLNVAPTSPLFLRRYTSRPFLPISTPTANVASSSASASARDALVEPNQNRFNLNEYYRLRNPLIRPILPSINSVASSSATASASALEGLSSASAASSVSAVSPSLNNFNLVFPRQKITNALGYDCLSPGDIVTVTLKNRSTLFGHVFDATSPITFNFLKPKLHASIFRNGRRVWNLLPRDFKDPACIRTLNNPLLLRHAF
jgi:hypothetical protein